MVHVTCASDGTSRLWITDFNTGKIFQVDVSDLAQPIVTTLVPNYGGTPNGIVHDAANDRLVVASWGANAKIKAISLSTNATSTLTTTNLSNIDGIDMDGQGNFYIAAWSPDKIVRYNTDFSQSSSVSVAGLNNPADICYALANDTLAIPNTGGNNILFVGFPPVSPTQHLDKAVPDLAIFPNPITDASTLVFHSNLSGTAQCYIFDPLGNVVFESKTHILGSGETRIPLRGFDAEPGLYWCVLHIGGTTIMEKVIKM